jgi:pyruvate formate lyase activating enzyme
MNFKGIQKTTLIDYPGKVACILFTGGCNFNCPFCYNKDLVKNPEKLPTITQSQALEFLEKRKKYLEGLVITGGEPTLHQQLPEFIAKTKKIGYKIKLDTNGTNPKMIEKLIHEKLVDYFAMDIKTSFENYEKACGTKTDIEKIKKSVKIIMKSGIDYEFRSTIMPHYYTQKDAQKIAQDLKGAKKYFLQAFNEMNGQTLIEPKTANKKKYSKKEALELKKILEKTIQKVELKNFD